MKKIFSLLLIVVLLFGTASTLFSSASQKSVDSIDAEKFAQEISAMIFSAEEKANLPGNIHDADNNYKEFETARLIVKSSSKIDTLDAVSVISGFDNLWVLQFDSPKSACEAFQYYSTRSGVEFVEPDKVIKSLDYDFESYYEPVNEKNYLSWGASHIGIDVFNKSVVANDIPVSDIFVAVVDTGVDPHHPHLEGRIIPTKINTSTSGIRNDSMDDAGHGTQVAGIIADCTLDNVYIKPYKVLDLYGNGTTVSVAAGINCAVKDGVDIINVSVGFEEDSEVLKSAIANAEQNDITVVSSAGNDGADTLYYPASYSSVLKIAAINESNVIANFSTFGSDIDFAAPGVNIITTGLNNSYSSVKGTSYASPFVSAIVAAMLSVDNKMSTEDIIDALIFDAIEVHEDDSKMKCGYGVVHAPELKAEGLGGKNKTAAPSFSLKSFFYSEEINLEIFCDTPNAVIYYTVDRTVPSKSNPASIIYDGTPIHFSQTVVLNAVAYCDNLYRSSVSTFSAIVAPTVDLNDILIDADGNVISYSGDKKSISIPSSVNGVEITGIGDNVFKDSDITEIILPKSVTKIGDGAFENCKMLKSVVGYGINTVGDRAFYNCEMFRNPYFDKLKSIGAYSFYNVCSRQYTLYELTFSLEMSELTTIPEGAFLNSAISNVILDSVNSIGKDAFLGCNGLVSVDINSFSSVLLEGAFRGCKSLATVYIGGLTFLPKAAFSTCENLKIIDAPDATFIGSNAFENCVSLMEVSLEKAETVNSDAFNGCVSLRILELPSMTEFEETIYGSSKKPTLPSNLETFKAPKMKRIVPDTFFNCKNIINIYLNSIEEIPEFAFRACHNIFFLNIQNVKTLNENSMAYCTIEFIDARSLVSAYDMPDNSGILLSNQFLESFDTATNLVVYGTPGTFVEWYSQHKGYTFVPIPLVYKEVPEYVTENSETVYITAVGFDLNYQWFWNTEKSTENAYAIDGATSNAYTFTDKDTAPYYFCRITQNDRNTITTIDTKIITKDTVPADYTEYNKAVNEANNLDRTIYESLTELDEALKVDVSGRYSCEQFIVDRQTQAIKDAISNLKVKIVKNISLYASETELGIFERVKIIAVVSPADALNTNIIWSTENDDVVIVSKNGYVRCIGDGTAIVCATVKNADGTETVGKISIECDLNTFEKIIGALFKYIFIVNNNYELNRVF